MKNSKRGLYIVILVVLIITAFFIFQSLTKNSLKYGNSGIAVDQSIEPTDDSEGGTGTMKYKDALAQYNNKIITLDTACGATPKDISITNNSKIMIDNRSPIDRIIKVDSLMNIKAYGFKIVNIAVPSSPVVLRIDCDKYTDVATVSVVK